jgi:RNA polymerase sigma-70 factor (ECF subfamily)
LRCRLWTVAHRQNHTSLDAHDDNGNERSRLNTLAADSSGPVRLQSREQATALIAAVERLPAQQREAFCCRPRAIRVRHCRATASILNRQSRLRYAKPALLLRSLHERWTTG